MQQGQQECLQSRVKQLERWFKIALFSWILGMTVIGLLLREMKEVNAQSKVIKGQGLIIVDDKGNPRIELVTRDKVCEIIFYDSMKSRRIILGVKPDGTPLISLCKGKQQIGITIQRDWSIIGLTDGEGNLRSLFGVDRKGLAVLNFCDDKKDKDFFVITAEPITREVKIRFFDATGKLRIGIGVLSNGIPDLRFFDKQGRILFKAP